MGQSSCPGLSVPRLCVPGCTTRTRRGLWWALLVAGLQVARAVALAACTLSLAVTSRVVVKALLARLGLQLRGLVLRRRDLAQRVPQLAGEAREAACYWCAVAAAAAQSR